MKFNILVAKESRNQEQRVSLIPADLAKLIEQGHKVAVEAGAGQLSGYSDQEYIQAGAEIRPENGDYMQLFAGVDLLLRAKRPDRQREIAEIEAIAKLNPEKFLMVGALDPYEKNSTHMQEYAAAGITAYSIDQLDLPADDPMNILASMSKIAGKLALQDALQKTQISQPKNAVVIGAGVSGMAAVAEAVQQGLNVSLILTNPEKAKTLQDEGFNVVLMARDLSLAQQQDFVREYVCAADIVITTARRAGQVAPVLIPVSTLDLMQAGSCIVDLAISEGGNVEGSEHDASLVLGNGVVVTNVSGYPKAEPRLASEMWSRASVEVIDLLAREDNRDQ